MFSKIQTSNEYVPEEKRRYRDGHAVSRILHQRVACADNGPNLAE